jgi:hypothetical protein
MKAIVGFIGGALLMPLALAGTSKTYPVGAFDRIEVSAGIELKVRDGAPQSVVARAEDDDFDHLEIKVDDGTLVVGRPHRWYLLDWFDDTHYTVDVTVPQLRGVRASSSARAEIAGAISRDAQISASSSGRVQVAEVSGGKVAVEVSSSGRLEFGVVKGDALSVEASSSGQVNIGELRVPMVDIRVSSSAEVEANGSCGTLRARANSSARILASGLRCENVTADVSSSGRVQAFASKGVTADASSSGRISIAGKPGRVEQHASSGGSIAVTD